MKKIVYLYRGIKIDDQIREVIIEQSEEGKSIAMFSNLEVKPLIKKLAIFIIQPSSLVT